VPAALGATKYKVLHNFGSGNDGSFPAGSVVQDKKGNLYGATGGGDVGCKGDGSGGTIFELAKQANGTWRESVLYCFGGQWTDGLPDSGLIIDNEGDLFGTSAGGPDDLSNVFELTLGAGGWSFSVLYSLGGGDLVSDGLGDIYGYLAPANIRLVLWLNCRPAPMAGTIRNFTASVAMGGGDGFGPSPAAPPNWDNRGNLYGTTLYGGNSESSGHKKFCLQGLGCGVAFRMVPNGNGTWTYHVLHRFAETKNDGQTPEGGGRCGCIWRCVRSHGIWGRLRKRDDLQVHSFRRPLEANRPL
jgi:hypothetical protein